MAEYSEGQQVLAYYNTMLYEAKVLRVERIPGKARYHYYIHYLKWNTKFDEWLEGDRLMPLNDATREKAKQINGTAIAALQVKPSASKKRGSKAESASSSAPVVAVAGGAASGKKRKVDASRDTEEPFTDSALKLSFPFSLKRQLVEDWELVTQRYSQQFFGSSSPPFDHTFTRQRCTTHSHSCRHLLVRLPVTVPVLSAAAVLDKYVAHVSSVAAGSGLDATAAASSSAPPEKSKKGRGGKEAAAAAAAESPAEPPAKRRGSAAAAATAAAATASESSKSDESSRAASISTAAESSPAVITARAVTSGLRQYFDRAAGTFLLYRFERAQFEALLRDLHGRGVSGRLSEVRSAWAAAHQWYRLSNVYIFLSRAFGLVWRALSQYLGAEHLLRLFIKLPELLTCSNISKPEAEALSIQINDILK